MNEIDFSGFFFGIGFANFFCRENAKIRIFMNGVEKNEFLPEIQLCRELEIVSSPHKVSGTRLSAQVFWVMMMTAFGCPPLLHKRCTS